MAAKTDTEKRTLIDHLARHMTIPRFIFALAMFFFWVMIIFPFFWMVSSSFKTGAEIAAREPVFIPADVWMGLLMMMGPSHLFHHPDSTAQHQKSPIKTDSMKSFTVCGS